MRMHLTFEETSSPFGLCSRQLDRPRSARECRSCFRTTARNVIVTRSRRAHIGGFTPLRPIVIRFALKVPSGSFSAATTIMPIPGLTSSFLPGS
jgi:hypothetical protein